MRQRPFGPGGPPIAVVGQGTWDMEKEPSRAVAALRRGLDLGLGHIDTAEMYGDGRVEELVGRAIRGRRSDAFLVSKVLPENAHRRGTVAACERSLHRLGTDHLDGYLLHWPGRHPLEETIAAFEELRSSGKIRSWGVSNFDEVELEGVVRLAGPGRVACNQVLYHLRERAIEHRVLEACRRHRVTAVAYSPFGSGRFPSPRGPQGTILREVAAAHGASPHQVALAFLLRHPDVLVIPRAADAEHLADNAGAGDLELDEDEIALIDQAFPRKGWRGGVPTL